MTGRHALENESQFALWNPKRLPTTPLVRSVVVAHGDIAIGESIALLLRLKGFAAAAARDMEFVESTLLHWMPRALLIDTRLCRQNNFRFIRDAASSPSFHSVLIVALSQACREMSPAEIRRVGFDGLCRKPCPLWM
ncbi:response regulator receiver protein, partial [Paraburkholderia aspalathi]